MRMTSYATPADTYMIIRADGASRNNQDKDRRLAAYALIVYREGEIIDRSHELIGSKTNNLAEYTGINQALVRAEKEQVPDGSEIVVQSDSEFAVKQIKGEYRLNESKFRPLRDNAREILLEPHIRLEYIPRDENSDADEEVQQAFNE